MSIQFDIAKQIIAETCPNRKLKLDLSWRIFAFLQILFSLRNIKKVI